MDTSACGDPCGQWPTPTQSWELLARIQNITMQRPLQTSQETVCSTALPRTKQSPSQVARVEPSENRNDSNISYVSFWSGGKYKEAWFSVKD